MGADSQTALTGRDGQFVVESSLVARTTKWEVNPKLATKSEWGDSDSAGYTNRAAGRKDATFTAEGKYDTDSEQWDLFAEGDTVLAVLWMNATLYWYFARALCDDFKISVDRDSQEVIGWTSGWGSDGKYYHPGQSGAPAATLPT